MAKQKLLTHEETVELVEQAQSGSEEALEKLINHTSRLIWGIVRKFKNKWNDPEDLFQIGVIGLMKAVQRFDTSFEVKFLSFCIPTITGEIQRFLRDNRIVRAPRSITELAYKIRSKDLTDKTPEEISEALEETNMKLIKDTLQYIKQGVVKSMEETVFSGKDGESITLSDQLQGDVNGDNWLDHIALRDAMENLDEREQSIVQMRYFQDMTQKEAGKALGLSQMHISRLEKAILLKLKNSMKEGESGMARKVRGDRREAIKLLKDTELTYSEISEQTDVPKGTVVKLAKDHRPPEVIKKVKAKNATIAREKKLQQLALTADDEAVSKEILAVTPEEVAKTKGPKGTQNVVTEGDDIVVYHPNGAEVCRVKDQSPLILDTVGTETGRLDVSKPNVSAVPKSEPEPSSNPQFVFNVRAEGKNISKEEALDQIAQALAMVRLAPSDELSFYIRVSN